MLIRRAALNFAPNVRSALINKQTVLWRFFATFVFVGQRAHTKCTDVVVGYNSSPSPLPPLARQIFSNLNCVASCFNWHKYFINIYTHCVLSGIILTIFYTRFECSLKVLIEISLQLWNMIVNNMASRSLCTMYLRDVRFRCSLNVKCFWTKMSAYDFLNFWTIVSNSWF